jgi:DNA-binding protein H-NS
MDYFNELLESYSRLKKRTFKLRFLTEQEEGIVNAQAIQAARNLVANPEGTNTGAMGDQKSHKSILRTAGDAQTPYAYLNQKGETIVHWTGFGRNPKVAVPGGNFEMMPEPQKGQLIGYFGDGAEANAQGEDGDSPEAFAQAELAGTIFDLGDIKQRLSKIYKHYVKFCEKSQQDKFKNKNATTPVPQGTLQDIERKCYRQAFSKVYGKTPGGLANLLNATVVNIEGEDVTLTEEASPGLVIAALANVERLFDFANNPENYKTDPELCSQFADSIAITTEKKTAEGESVVARGGSDRLIFFGATSGEGIVIPGQSQDFKKAMTKAQDRCKAHDKYRDGLFNKVDFRQLSTASINAKKGTLHERLSGLLVNLHRVINTDNGDVRNSLLERFVGELERAGEVASYLIESVVSEDGEERVASIDEAIANDLGIQESMLFDDREDLKNFLIDYYKGMQTFLNKIQPDGLVHNGLASTTGGREDQFMVFSSPEKAQAAAKKLGITSDEVNREEFIGNSEDPEATKAQLDEIGVEGDTMQVIGMGQKLYAELKGGKVGEFNTIDRLFSVVLGSDSTGASIDAVQDKHLDDGFFAALDNYMPLGEGAKTKVEDLRSEVATIHSYINGETQWVDDDGIEHTMGSQADATVKHLLTSLGWEDLQESDLGKILKNYKGTDLDKQLLGVELQRLHMAKRMEDWSKSKSGKESLLRMAFAAGGNTRDMIQSIFVQDGKKHYAINHNSIFHKFKEALDAGTLSVKVEGFTVKFDDGHGFEGSLKTEGTWAKEKATRNIRTLFDISKNTIKKLNESRLKGEPIEDSLQQLFAVQNMLLEKLLS